MECRRAPTTSAYPAGKNHPQLWPILRVRSAANCAAFQRQQALAIRLMLWSNFRYLVRLERHPGQRRRLHREWLGGPILISRIRIIVEHRALFHFVNRLPGYTVDDEQ